MIKTVTAAEDMLCTMKMPLADDALYLWHIIWHVPDDLTRDSGSMSLVGTSLL
jgi:hypothetical protein